MIARWTCQTRFGHQKQAIALLEEWEDEIGRQTDLDMDKARMLVGSVGAREATVQTEFEIASLAELDAFFAKIASIKMHEDWGRKVGEVLVSGSTYWEVFRLQG